MKSLVNRILGIVIVLLSVASLLLSIYVMRQVWRSKIGITNRLLAAKTDASGFLENTRQTLDVLETITIETSLTISTTQTSLLTLAQATHDTSGMLGSLVTLTGETLPDFITSTQNSVNSAKDTARLMDGIMNAISKIPFLNQPYNPEKSLSASLAQISTDLDRFNPQLKTMNDDLQHSQTNLSVMETQVKEFAKSLGATQEKIKQVEVILGQYQDQIAKLQAGLSTLEKHIPRIVLNVTLWMLFFIAWLAIFQVYIAYKGLYIFFHPR